MLEIKDLHVSVEGKEILKGLNLSVEKGQVHALMGPNGSGKSTLANVIMGNPLYKVTKGDILLHNKSITSLRPDERAKGGVFLSFQYPQEIAGVSISKFLRQAHNSLNTGEEKLSVLKFKDLLNAKLRMLGFDQEFGERYLNQGFSGGEKKKAEVLQLLVLNPKIAILDETDSGLDIDALKSVSIGINAFKSRDNAVLIITHYKRILEYVKPNKISIMVDGKVAFEGDGDLASHLEEKGYGWITKEDEKNRP